MHRFLVARTTRGVMLPRAADDGDRVNRAGQSFVMVRGQHVGEPAEPSPTNRVSTSATANGSDQQQRMYRFFCSSRRVPATQFSAANVSQLVVECQYHRSVLCNYVIA